LGRETTIRFIGICPRLTSGGEAVALTSYLLKSTAFASFSYHGKLDLRRVLFRMMDRVVRDDGFGFVVVPAAGV
jgi:hypothetical protein